MRNQYSVGVSPTTNTLGERTFANKFQDLQVGARLGGAIIKNKLFYFVNFEVGRRTEPIGFVPGDGNSLVSASNVATVYARALALGYDPGSGTEDFIRRNETNKFFIRFDWNISDKHKVTLRHNYNYGFQLDLARSTTNFNFANGAISFPSTTNSTVLEWRAILNNKFSNNLLLTYTSIRDDRNPVGSNFPRIAVQDGTTNIRLGPEEFSVQNRLDQDILSLTNNFDMYLGKHTLTIGTHIEFFQFANLFIRDNFGSYTYGSVADFVNNARPRNFNLSYGIRNGVPDATFVPEARFRAVQLGFYVQDDFEVNKKLRLTAGLRIDVPFILDNPAANLTYNNSAQAIASETRTDKVPASNILFSPRLGFNYDVLGDRTLQIRGGLGVFTGRIPFVWLSNQFGNTGTDVGRIGVTVPATGTGSTFRFAADPFNQYNNAIGSGLVPASTTEINVTDKNFQYPQVFRANLAIDYKLPFGGLIATVEGLFSQSINAIDYKDLNLGNPTTSVPGGDGRPIYPNNGLVGVVATNGGSARTSLNPAFTNIVYLGNTNQGYTYNFTAQIQRPFRNGISGSIAYNYGDAFSINDGTNSQAVSNWRFTPNREGVNNLSLTRSNFSAGHRLIIAATYRKEYANNKFATSVSLFYTRQSGAPYSITYINDFNREDLSNTTSNDLIYIPNSASEINFITNTRGTVTTADDLSPAQQWEILNNYIENNRFAERNGARTPTTDQLDLRLMQEVFFDIKGRRQTLQLTFDVFNVLNALNKDWGFQYFVSNQNFSLINFAGFQSATGLPTFTINPPSNNEYLMPGRSNFGSRWQAQFGIRYIF
ncbi:MAG: TonB-dependent receptor [Cytophagales bacterium]|nr:MAG: TonB-dependent receptor [Cytophagales bacterium]